MGFFVIFTIGSLFLTILLRLLTDWDLSGHACPGDAGFCGGLWWTTLTRWLPGALFVGNLAAIFALATDRAWLRF